MRRIGLHQDPPNVQILLRVFALCIAPNVHMIMMQGQGRANGLMAFTVMDAAYACILIPAHVSHGETSRPTTTQREREQVEKNIIVRGSGIKSLSTTRRNHATGTGRRLWHLVSLLLVSFRWPWPITQRG